jgi:CheY-like chemotaxis protein
MSSLSNNSNRPKLKVSTFMQYHRTAGTHTDNRRNSRHIVRKDYKSRALPYNADDILIVCNSSTSTGPLSRYFTRMKVRTADPLDEGRNITCACTTSPSEAAELIVHGGHTYGFILTDLFFDDEMSGRELVRIIRGSGYSNAIIYLVDSGIEESMENNFMNVGADALLVKGTKTMKVEFTRLVRDLVFRNVHEDDGTVSLTTLN